MTVIALYLGLSSPTVTMTIIVAAAVGYCPLSWAVFSNFKQISNRRNHYSYCPLSWAVFSNQYNSLLRRAQKVIALYLGLSSPTFKESSKVNWLECYCPLSWAVFSNSRLLIPQEALGTVIALYLGLSSPTHDRWSRTTSV